MLLAGEFRQTSPVYPQWTRADKIKACLKSSYLWPKLKVLSLMVNMRAYLRGDNKSAEFSDLLKIGNGSLDEDSSNILISDKLCKLLTDLNDLTEMVYPDLQNVRSKNMSWRREEQF
ncbi:MAG: hypothetical protein ACEY3F_07780 [Wolbachia sp.]